MRTFEEALEAAISRHNQPRAFHTAPAPRHRPYLAQGTNDATTWIELPTSRPGKPSPATLMSLQRRDYRTHAGDTTCPSVLSRD